MSGRWMKGAPNVPAGDGGLMGSESISDFEDILWLLNNDPVS